MKKANWLSKGVFPFLRVFFHWIFLSVNQSNLPKSTFKLFTSCEKCPIMRSRLKYFNTNIFIDSRTALLSHRASRVELLLKLDCVRSTSLIPMFCTSTVPIYAIIKILLCAVLDAANSAIHTARDKQAFKN